MPKFSANISTLFCEYSPMERIGKAAAAGFDAIEIQFPYELEPHALRAELEANQMPLVLMNFPVGDLMRGGDGLAAIPGRETEFEQALEQARAYAGILRPRAMNLLAGRPGALYDPADCEAAFRTSLRQASEITRELGIQLLTEPVNSIDLPGFLLDDSQQVLDLMAAMPDIEFGLQYDLYHMQMMQEDIARRLPRIISRIGHIQFSDLPGRTEPGLGCIDFAAMFALIDSLPYAGYVGAEYFPTRPTLETLDWLEQYRERSAAP